MGKKNDGKRLAAMSLGLNVFFGVIEFFLYLSTKSSALLAAAVHTVTDVIGSFLIIVGIYLSEKKSERFPWGLYKIENISAVLVAGLIFLSAYEIAKNIYRPSPLNIENLTMTLVVLFFMAFSVVFFSKYEAKRAKMLNSPSLMADAESWRMDIAPLAVVAAGIAGARFSYPVIDRVAAVTVLIIVIRAGYEIMRDSVKSLLDASVDRATLNAMIKIIEGFSEVKEIISLNARNSGRFIFVHLELSFALKRLKEAHEVAEDIDKEIKRRIPFVERVIIHYEPERKDHQRYAVPLLNREGEISKHFGSAPFIALWDKRITDGVSISQEIVENPFLQMEKKKGIRLADLLVEKGIDTLYLREDFEGKGPKYVLSDAGVEVRRTSLQNLKELIGLKEKGIKNPPI